MSATKPEAPVAGHDLDQLRAELKRVDALSVAQVEKAYRRLSKARPTADIKVAWLGNHTMEPVARAAAVSAFVHDLVIDDYVGPFDQYFQPILDDESELIRFAPQVIVLWLSLRGLAPALVAGGAGLSAMDREAHAEAVLRRIGQWVEQAKRRTRATLFVANFPRPPRAGLGLADLRSATGAAALISRLNLELANTYRDDPRVIVLDVEHAVASVGGASGWNPRMYHLAKIEWDGATALAVGQLLARALSASVKPARKCLAVDLDNTFWGGVVGEDGPKGIKISEGDPTGECFLAFQRALVDLKARGILLAICSKNNPEDVQEAFAANTMPLSLDDFAAVRINWDNKPDNLRDIARQLNIGTDSLVFVDDSPVECALVRQLVPEIHTIHLPGDPAAYADLLLDAWELDRLIVTAEDSRKTEQYRENAARSAAQASTGDLTAYLESLGTRVRIAAADQPNLARLHQLFTKTNQFNSTSKRYTPSEVEAFATSPDWRLEFVHAQDNFGDLGIIGLYLLFLGSDQPVIDSFILSCRAMGRGIETVMCNRIKQVAFVERQAQALRARFVPTSKNKPAAGFYDSQGFRLASAEEDGTRIYILQKNDSVELPCPGIASVEMENNRE